MTFWLNGAIESKSALYPQIKNALTIIINGISSKHEHTRYNHQAFNAQTS
jgi:hypothetical protein